MRWLPVRVRSGAPGSSTPRSPRSPFQGRALHSQSTGAASRPVEGDAAGQPGAPPGPQGLAVLPRFAGMGRRSATGRAGHPRGRSVLPRPRSDLEDHALAPRCPLGGRPHAPRCGTSPPSARRARGGGCRGAGRSSGSTVSAVARRSRGLTAACRNPPPRASWAHATAPGPISGRPSAGEYGPFHMLPPVSRCGGRHGYAATAVRRAA